MAFGLGVAKGMLTTISHLVKPPVTIQYPEERLEMPIWTRGRPRLIYEVDTGELRCTACGACALACPVDVIKIEQHPSPIKGKILDRFDIDMAGLYRVRAVRRGVPVPRDHHGAGLRDGRDVRPRERPGVRHVRAAHRRARPRSTPAWSTSRASNAGSRGQAARAAAAAAAAPRRPRRSRAAGRRGRPVQPPRRPAPRTATSAAPAAPRSRCRRPGHAGSRGRCAPRADRRGRANGLRPADDQRRGSEEAARRRPRRGLPAAPDSLPGWTPPAAKA